MMQFTSGQHASKLYLSQRQTFGIYFVAINLFFLYLMKFFHTMLDAAGIVLRVHYESTKCDVLFSRGSVSTEYDI